MVEGQLAASSCVGLPFGQASAYPSRSESPLRNSARRICRALVTGGDSGTATCACNTGAQIPIISPSASNAFGVKSLQRASPNQLPFHRSLGGTRLIVLVFEKPLAMPIRTVLDPSIGTKYLPCSKREFKGPERQLDRCTGTHHTRSPNCATGEIAGLPTIPHSFRVMSSQLERQRNDGANL